MFLQGGDGMICASEVTAGWSEQISCLCDTGGAPPPRVFCSLGASQLRSSALLPEHLHDSAASPKTLRNKHKLSNVGYVAAVFLGVFFLCIFFRIFSPSPVPVRYFGDSLSLTHCHWLTVAETSMAMQWCNAKSRLTAVLLRLSPISLVEGLTCHKKQ